MAQRLPTARESVVYYATWNLSPDQILGAVDITGYTFALDLTRQIGAAADIVLGMAAAEPDEGFRVVSGPSLLMTIRILPATLAGVNDTTGDFQLFGDLLAQPPGADRFWVTDLILPITKGPTP